MHSLHVRRCYYSYLKTEVEKTSYFRLEDELVLSWLDSKISAIKGAVTEHAPELLKSGSSSAFFTRTSKEEEPVSDGSTACVFLFHF